MLADNRSSCGDMPGPAKQFDGTLRIRVEPELLEAFRELAEARHGERAVSEMIRAYMQGEVDAAGRRDRPGPVKRKGRSV